MEREGAPLSPECAHALDIVLRAEARSVNWLESSLIGMESCTRATTALPRQVHSHLILSSGCSCSPKFSLRTTITSVGPVVVVAVRHVSPPAPFVTPAERWKGHSSSNNKLHQIFDTFVNTPLPSHISEIVRLARHRA
jgi:hypothetical protein